jgi:hypothetical protein
VSVRAYQQALAYAKERLQGTRGDGTRFPIIEFPDVRRMLMTMKSVTEAMRGLAYVAAAEIDRERHEPDPEKRAASKARVELYTPIVKGWITEMSQEITSLGIQVYGGMGYVEETGVAQHYRDARITTIYEGTTGIQAQDLVGRKFLANQGEVLGHLLDEVAQTAESLTDSGDLADLGGMLDSSVDASRDASRWLLEHAADDRSVAGAASVNFMMMLGFVCGAWVLGRSALKASAMLSQGSGDRAFLEAKLHTTRFYFEQVLPRAQSCGSMVTAGSGSTMALAEEQF